MNEQVLSIHYKLTPWYDALMGGKTCQITLHGLGIYSELENLYCRSTWLSDHLKKEGYVYVSTSIDADDIVGKAVIQHMGFDFISQSTTCILRLTNDVSLIDTHEDFIVAESRTVNTQEVIELCNSTLRHGRFKEDYFIRKVADKRYADFLNDLASQESVYKFFTRSSTGKLNGYAYIPIKSGSADLMMMGIDESQSPPQGGKFFWELCLSHLRAKKLALRISTRAPAANLGVFNIYSKIGFSFIRPEYDFRMFPNLIGNNLK
jgi:hypothetical protein